MSLFDLFRPAEPQAQPQQQQQQPQQQPTGQQQQQQTPQQESTTTTNDSSLEQFASLWENSSEGEAGAQQSLADLISIDPNAIREHVQQNMNFAQGITPEIMDQISQGGEAGQQAFASAINSATQQAFTQAFTASATMLRQVLEQSGDRIDSQINGRLRDSQVSQTVGNSNPVFNDPAMRPMVEMLQSRLAQQNPQASSEEIANQVTRFFSAFADTMNAPQREQERQQASAGQTNWANWLNS